MNRQRQFSHTLSGKELQMTALSIAAQTMVLVLTELLIKYENNNQISIDEIETTVARRIREKNLGGRLDYISEDSKHKLKETAIYRAYQLGTSMWSVLKRY